MSPWARNHYSRDESNFMLVQQGHLCFDSARLEQFCTRWKIDELYLFGSALRDDFRTDSDLDFLVRFQPDVPWDLLHIGEMQAELENWFGRQVDLVELEQLKNPIRKQRILDTRRVLFATG